MKKIKIKIKKIKKKKERETAKKEKEEKRLEEFSKFYKEIYGIDIDKLDCVKPIIVNKLINDGEFKESKGIK